MKNSRPVLYSMPGLLLVLLGLLVGLSIVLAGVSTHAHARADSVVSTCTETGLNTAIGSTPFGGTVTFGCSGTIAITTTLTINQDLTLDGSGQMVTLDGGGTTQVLLVSGGVVFTLKHLTIANGSASSGSGGGGLENFPSSTVSISNSTFNHNSASFGGGLFNFGGTVTISNSTFTNNSASFGSGGGLDNGGTMIISNSTFDHNSTSSSSAGGSGLFNDGPLTISNSTFTNNSASFGRGGGLENLSTVSISNSTFDHNSAGGGGGLDNEGGTVSISNSTFANNSASFGGGLQNFGSVTITFSTFANNSASPSDGGGLFNGGTPLKIMASIVANNTGGNCFSTPTDQGYNLESATDCGFTGTGDLQNTNPLLDLAGLANNGGLTQTIALQSTSPAIDHIPVAQCPATDQRGFPRPDDNESTCDIGAYESGAKDVTAPTLSLPSTITVNATSPQGATVSYTVTATDPDNLSSQLTISCSPASGSTFAIGTTTVNCSASDPAGNTTTGSFQVVVVKDTTPPVLSLPGTITVVATSPQGAVVRYTVTATDPDNSPSELTISCSPASGSTFPIGTTTVNCSATDPAGNTGTGSFQVIVLGASALVSNLISLQDSFHLDQSLQNALDNKLQDVLTAITAGQTATACSELTDYIGHVQSQSGKGLTTRQAIRLIRVAQLIQAVLAC